MSASLLDRLRGGLARTREVLETPVGDLLSGRRPLDPAALEALEEALLAADLGLPWVQEAMERLRRGPLPGGISALRGALRDEIRRALEGPAPPAPFRSRPWVVFVVGVNGAGKTTTIGKLARAWKNEGRSVLLCAADTFRAAAAEQLAVWAERAEGSFHRGAEGAEPSAVLTDGLRAAKARGQDAVLVDTAGRLHTKGNLMAELAKMVRVAGREVPGAPHETLLVLDATVGSNGLAQAREFARSAGVTGLVLAKLDGTAKGGVAVAVVRELGVPIRYVGVGESAEDLLPFDAAAFTDSLLGWE
ncbi:MAG TPA: signal recognition particle-docking protein FtsY [Vicinamibacteria bacterium]|nr:signal recognition particle-docking protein FtsY [Vicinamibacteria bacterium]